jgi:aldehyde:ferredoxin oxidoreductase
MHNGYKSYLLDINLTDGNFSKKEISREHQNQYVGGRGLGARLLYDETKPGLDPFDQDMVLIFSVGPLTGTSAPQSNRFVVTTKSPLTGTIADSHCGGSFATKLKKAGYDAVIIRGKSNKPVYIEIDEDDIQIKDASHLWGKTTTETQQALPENYGKAVIGPAGENKVRYACIVSQNRVAGRGGTGAVMGEKNLKAVIATGRKKSFIALRDKFRDLQQSIAKLVTSHPMTGNILSNLGTANLVMTTAGRNIIPTRNYQAGHDPKTPEISGEKLRDELLVSKDGCLSCPIRCGRKVKVKGVNGKGPEFETIGLIGNNLNIFNLEEICELGQLCDDLGLDTISCGNTLGFATELSERGMFSSNLKWGDTDTYRQAIQDIAYRQGIGNDLAEGVRRMSEKYGGQEFGIQVKGLELPAYDPRGCYGQGLEYATTNRGGCHIRGATMQLEALGPLNIDPHSTKSKPELVVFQQNLNASISSLVMCYFSAYAVIPASIFKLNPNGLLYRSIMSTMLYSGPILRLVLKNKTSAQLLWFEKFLSLTIGQPISSGKLNEIGERIINLERLYNLREGSTKADDTLPDRLLNQPTFPDQQSGVPLAEMLESYYKIRGWDSKGTPTTETLARLNIQP